MIIKIIRLLWWFLLIRWNFLIPIFVLMPFFIHKGDKNSGLIRLLLGYCWCIVHTIMGSSKTLNYMNSGFLQYNSSWLDSIFVFLVVTSVFHNLVYHSRIFLQHTSVRSCNTNLFSIIWFNLPVIEFCSYEIIHFLCDLLFIFSFLGYLFIPINVFLKHLWSCFLVNVCL